MSVFKTLLTFPTAFRCALSRLVPWRGVSAIDRLWPLVSWQEEKIRPAEQSRQQNKRQRRRWWRRWKSCELAPTRLCFAYCTYCTDKSCTETHTSYQLRGISKSPSKRIDHEAQPHTNSFSQPPIFYVPTYKPTYNITQGSAEAQQDFDHKLLLGRLHFLSLRWITNNNNYYIFFFSGALERGKRGVPALCFFS
jgi:hypothetical protein